VPTLAIGFWPRLAIDFYQASTDALSAELGQLSVQALALLPPIG
jgi:NAD(P)H-quinone oxidoreductase subunit 4